MEGDEVNNYETTRLLSSRRLRKAFPPKARLEKGPVVVIECIQKIPCDPCVHICRFRAIKKRSLVHPPEIDYEKCTGCGECIAVCPGLAIFVVNLNYRQDEALVILPYELLPTPEKGEIYEALDRKGKPRGKARIIAVKKMKDRTLIVTVAVRRKLAMTVRNIERKLD